MFWAPQIFLNLISTMDHFLCKFHILFQLKKLLFIGLYFRGRHHFTPRPSPSPIQIHTEKTCQQFHQGGRKQIFYGGARLNRKKIFITNLRNFEVFTI